MSTKSEHKDALIGARLGDYVIQAMIGRGGMARVYEGLDERLHRRAAIKVIEVEHGAGDEMTERFIREARAVANLDHPNIVGVYQFGEAPHLYYLAMKLVEGETLQAILRKKRKQKKFLGSDEIVKIVTETAAAIDYAHKQNVIHRDIKPSNIICSKEGRTILTDFGLLMQLDGDSTLGTAFGTPRYIAPEQAISSHRSVPQSDIYSLGIVVYEMLTGQTPFDNDSPMSLALSHISNPPPSPRALREEVPPHVETVVLKALEKRPENRWQTATEFSEALRQAYLGIDPGVTLTQEPLDMPVPGRAPASNGDEKPVEVAVPGPIEQPGAQSDDSARPVQDKKPRLVRWLLPLVMLLSLIIIVGVGALASASTAPNVKLLSVPATPTVGPRIRLIYSKDLFIIYNATGQTVSLEGIKFRRNDANSQLYEAVLPGNSSNKAFSPGQCVGIQRSGPDQSLPAVCDPKISPTNFDDSAVFWTMRSETDSVTTFVVQQGGQVLQTCWMHLDSCEFELP